VYSFIRGYFPVERHTCGDNSGMSPFGPSLTNCSACPMSGIGAKAEVDDHALLGFDPSLLEALGSERTGSVADVHVERLAAAWANEAAP
jgi:hypothetical protein